LDSEAFVAARARYSQKLEELRAAKARLFYHDETWVSLREVKRSIWTLEGEGRVKKGEGKGKLGGSSKFFCFLPSVVLNYR
jgi:hypothetical protein